MGNWACSAWTARSIPPLHYPGDYGFIPGTLAEDHDPLDVLTLVDEPSYPGVPDAVRPVGVLEMVDQDEPDQKILAVPLGDHFKTGHRGRVGPGNLTPSPSRNRA